MKTILFVLVMAFSCLADVEVDMWLLPVRIHYQDSRVDTAWLYYNPWRTPALQQAGPVTGKNLLYLDKLQAPDSLRVSRKLFAMPDGFRVLVYDKTIAMKDVVMIETLAQDSLQPQGVWGNRLLTGPLGKLALEKKPLFMDLVVLEQDAAYNAVHVYGYDKTWSKEKVRTLLLKKGIQAPELQTAMKELRILLIEEVTP